MIAVGIVVLKASVHLKEISILPTRIYYTEKYTKFIQNKKPSDEMRYLRVKFILKLE